MTPGERQRAIRAARRANGLCVDCADPAPVYRGLPRSRCEDCQAKARSAQARLVADVAEVDLPESKRIVVERVRINARALQSCPVCGWRDIETIGQYDADRIPMCGTCAEDVGEVKDRMAA